jgi:AraC-like DNA-binding protein
MVEQHQIYALSLRSVFNFLISQGASESALFEGTNLSLRDMKDPYSVLSADQAHQFFLNVLKNSDEPGIGLEIGWLSDLSHLGPYGLAQKSARTIGEAAREGAENFAFFYLLADYLMHVENGLARCCVLTHTQDPGLHRFTVERILATVQAHAEELSGGKILPVKLLVDYPEPENSTRYREIFQCPLHFSQQVCELHYDATTFDMPVASYDPQVQQVMQGLRSNLLTKLTAKRDVVGEVNLHLRREPGKYPTLEEVANRLAMSSRTLRRRLSDKETSFQALLDAQRHHLACDFLLGTTMNIQQIADYCGFNDARNFTQAFKRWEGLNPSEYREHSVK